MAPKSVAAPAKSKGFNFLPWWVWVWFVVSQLVVLWDGAFVFLRPDSFPGGKYAHFFGPYELYISIDKVYANLEDAFCLTQSLINLLEVAVGFLAFFLHLGGSRASVLVAFTAATMTVSKTILYLGLEIVSGFENVGHNDLRTLVALYLVPNGLWIIVPFFIMVAAGSRILCALAAVDGAKKNN